MRDKPREAKSKRIRFFGRPLEVLPRGIRDEALDDVACSLWTSALVEESERDGVSEGPSKESIVVAWQDLDVDRHVGSLAGSVAVQE